MLKKYASEGEISLKIVGGGASVGLSVCGFLGVFGNFLSFNLFGAVFDALLLAIGMLCVSYEFAKSGDDKTFIHRFNSDVGDFVKTELHILSTPYGRSMIYIVMGIILTTQSSITNLVVGLAVSGCGGYICYNMHKAESILNSMKTHMREEDLKPYFDKYDKDRSGTLDPSEVAEMCKELGIELNRAELEATVNLLKDSKTNTISLENFKSWYLRKM